MKAHLALGIIAALAVGVSATARGQEDARTPKQKYSAIFKRYSPVSGGLRAAKTDLERKEAVEGMSVFAAPLNALAAEHPDDPIALTALRQAVQIVGSTDSAALQTWEMNTADFVEGSSDGSAAKTVELVLRDHVNSAELAPVLDRMRYGYRLEYETCLEQVLEKNPHHEIRGLACLVLAQYLNDKLRMIELVDDRAELARCYGIVFGKDYLPALRKLGSADLPGRVEALFERAGKEFADVEFRGSTVGDWAWSELYDIRHLSVGRVAPNIEGHDQDNVAFQLSDYRGKVVLLYFWSEF